MVASIEGLEFDVVQAVGEVLDRAVLKSSGLRVPASEKTLFDARYPTPMCIEEYAERLKSYFLCSDECHVLGLVYIERILERDSSFLITELNVHRILLVATVIAAKFQDDEVYSNRYYARVGGVSCKELQALEADFLVRIGWRAHVTPDDYNNCLRRLRSHALALLLPEIVDDLCLTGPAAQLLPTPSVQIAEAESGSKLMNEVTAPEAVEMMPALTRKSATVRPDKQCKVICQHPSRRRDWRHPRTRFDERRTRNRPRERGIRFARYGLPQ